MFGTYFRVDYSFMRFEGFTRDYRRRITCCLGKVCCTSLYDRKSSLLKVSKRAMSCSARNQGNLTAYRTSDEQYFRELVLGSKPSCARPHFLALLTGDGSVKQVAGHRIGRLLNKQKTPAMNLSTVDVKLHLGGDASV